MDLEPMNAAIRAQGSAEVDVILGLDVFDPHAAVIDYRTQSLFLRAVAAEPGAAADGEGT
jgi:hypothetical protein